MKIIESWNIQTGNTKNKEISTGNEEEKGKEEESRDVREGRGWQTKEIQR